MGQNMLAGQNTQATTAAGGLNQYYGYADCNTTTVTAASYTTLSTQYTIPAGEPYADASYVLTCAGYGTWGSTQEALTLIPYLGSSTVSGPGREIAAAAFSASAAFDWWVMVELTCADGIEDWQVSMTGAVCQTANAIVPGTAADNSVTLAGATSTAATAAISGSIAVCVQAKWGATTGSPTITTVRTNFRKVA